MLLVVCYIVCFKSVMETLCARPILTSAGRIVYACSNWSYLFFSHSRSLKCSFPVLQVLLLFITWLLVLSYSIYLETWSFMCIYFDTIFMYMYIMCMSRFMQIYLLFKPRASVKFQFPLWQLKIFDSTISHTQTYILTLTQTHTQAHTSLTVEKQNRQVL